MEEYRSGHNEAVLKTVWVKAHGGSNPSSSANKTDKHFLLVRFVFRYLIRGIRTRALRKRHSASFLAADRRLLQSIKIADQGCFAKDKNESLFLRQKSTSFDRSLSILLFHSSLFTLHFSLFTFHFSLKLPCRFLASNK